MVKTNKFAKSLTSIWPNLNYFDSFEVVDRVSETQLQVGENSTQIKGQRVNMLIVGHHRRDTSSRSRWSTNWLDHLTCLRVSCSELIGIYRLAAAVQHTLSHLNQHTGIEGMTCQLNSCRILSVGLRCLLYDVNIESPSTLIKAVVHCGHRMCWQSVISVIFRGIIIHL